MPPTWRHPHQQPPPPPSPLSPHPTPRFRAPLAVLCISCCAFLLSISCYQQRPGTAMAASTDPCPTAAASSEAREASIFTQIIRREAPATILYEDDLVIAFLGLNQVAPVQFLVAPKKQLASLEEAHACDEPLLGRMFTVASLVAKQRGVTNGYRLVLNNGDDALQAVPHLHMHVFAGQTMDWPPGTGPIYRKH